ncbi:MAG: pantetheine-phosphate adenylyltransferase [Fusobacteriaceae bacterium]
MKKAIYSGSFDPITRGHVDIIVRASKICDKLIVAVLNNVNKKYMFNLEERLDMVKESFKEYKNIEVTSFDGLLVDFMEKNEINLIYRGIRAVSDYEYELAMAYANYEISSEKVETVFIPARKEFMYLSSTVVRDVALNGGNLKFYLDEYVEKKVIEKISRINLK